MTLQDIKRIFISDFKDRGQTFAARILAIDIIVTICIYYIEALHVINTTSFEKLPVHQIEFTSLIIAIEILYTLTKIYIFYRLMIIREKILELLEEKDIWKISELTIRLQRNSFCVVWILFHLIILNSIRLGLPTKQGIEFQKYPLLDCILMR